MRSLVYFVVLHYLPYFYNSVRTSTLIKTVRNTTQNDRICGAGDVTAASTIRFLVASAAASVNISAYDVISPPKKPFTRATENREERGN